jgi:hypothetical protein
LQGPSVFGCRGLTRRDLANGRTARLVAQHIASSDRAYNIRFDDKVARPPDHEKVFDIVAANQDKAPPSVDGCGVDYGEPRLPSTRSISKPVCPETPHQPCGETDKGQHHQKGDEKAGGQRHFSAEQALKHQCAPFFPLSHVGRESTEWLIPLGTI